MTDIEITSLMEEHTRLEREIEKEYRRAAPDDGHIAELKRRKLQIKDKIAGLEAA